ncbi:hypothetical protein [Cohnella mopanensis]|uniref:hypothetical protein n=1 Tax=Cohnella mopanensis TaxID=2911966 RepID=UPI001EF8468F|nr:hypothetical protein [Cohnella mopanensis]
MQFAGFMFFSTIEYLASFSFILVLFRFSFRENSLKFGVFALVLSLVSQTLQTEFLQATSSLIQTLLIILFFYFFLKVTLFNSAVMVITGYLLNFIVQWTFAGIYMHFGIVQELLPYTRDGYLLQTSSVLVMALLTVLIVVLKGGFSFVENYNRINKSKFFSKQNRLFLLFIVISLFTVFIANLLLMVTESPPYLLVSIFLMVSMLVLIFLTVRKDERID